MSLVRVTAVAVFLIGATTLGCDRTAPASADGDVLQQSELTRAIAGDSTLRAADAEIRSGHPWLATRRLAPIVSDTKRRSDAAVLLAARAAAAWEGWSEVDRLLATQPWLDSRFDAEGRELLARSALGQDQTARAVEQSRAAAAPPRLESRTRAVRQVLLGRSLDRAQDADGAKAAYASAASTYQSLGDREVADWLRLRAAGAEREEGARKDFFGDVKSAVARTRIGWTDAQARERFGDPSGAAERYAGLGDTVSALRLELSAARDSGERQSAKDRAVAFVARHAGSADARTAIGALDASFPRLPAPDELVIARAAGASGVFQRAVTSYARADSAGLLQPNDQLQYGIALGKVGRTRDALSRLALVRAPSALAADAAYQRARLQLGTPDAARASLRKVATDYPAEEGTASAALFLLADLLVDAKQDAAARSTFRELTARYPRSSRADDARFQAAMIDMATGAPRPAALSLDSLVALHPSSPEAPAARYWAGRAWAAVKDSAKAKVRWRAVVADEPLSYYALLSAKRLGTPFSPIPASSATTTAAAPEDDPAARLRLLSDLGLDAEARIELAFMDSVAAANPARAREIAETFARSGEPGRALRIALKLLGGGSQGDTGLYRLAFPIVERAELVRNAKANGIDPSIAAGLIRQESSFNPRAVSVAGARGLMQVMPPVGQQLARSLNFPAYTPGLLFDPDANLQLGTTHLASSLRRHAEVERVLAAYNAGETPVGRWITRGGAGDHELFVERIPYAETRDYVRIVLRNAAVYRLLLQ